MRLFIIDNQLEKLSGHYYNLARGLQSFGKRNGVETLFYANRNLDPDLATELRARPVFEFTHWHRTSKDPLCGSLEDMLLLGNRFAISCLALNDNNVNYNDVVLMLSTQQNEFYGIGEWLKRVDLRNRPVTVFNFLNENYLIPHKNLVKADIACLYRFSYRNLKKNNSRIILTTPSKRISEVLSNIIMGEVKEYPLPKYYFDDEVPNLSKTDNPGNFLRVSFLGPYLKRKGAHMLPNIIHLCTYLDREVKFFVQFFLYSGVDVCKETGSYLISNENVTVCNEALSISKYLKILHETDIVLLPYDPVFYEEHPSGPFSEAVAFGKVVVVPNNTWMSRHVNSGYGGGVTFDEFTPDAIARAIREAVKRYDDLKVRAEASSQSWRQNQSLDAYMRRLFEELSQRFRD